MSRIMNPYANGGMMFIVENASNRVAKRNRRESGNFPFACGSVWIVLYLRIVFHVVLYDEVGVIDHIHVCYDALFTCRSWRDRLRPRCRSRSTHARAPTARPTRHLCPRAMIHACRVVDEVGGISVWKYFRMYFRTQVRSTKVLSKVRKYLLPRYLWIDCFLSYVHGNFVMYCIVRILPPNIIGRNTLIQESLN